MRFDRATAAIILILGHSLFIPWMRMDIMLGKAR
jgi:hypothetical protein